MTTRAEIEERVAEIDAKIAECNELLHRIETVEQEHGHVLPPDERDELRDEIERQRERINRARVKVSIARAETSGDGR